MSAYKTVTLIVISVLVAILLASALNSFTRVPDPALAQISPLPWDGGGVRGGGSNAPRTLPGKNYLPIIFLNSATAGGAWLLAGNAGTVYGTDFLGTTDNVTFTIRVSNTAAFRIAPAVDPTYGFAPNIIGGYSGNNVAPGVHGATIAGGGVSGYVNSVGAGGNSATIGGGANNTASGNSATIGGGFANTASNSYATVGGGFFNTASGYIATVGGGGSNIASGYAATGPGGFSNVASGNFSFAAGQHANTNNMVSAFVWADNSTPTDLKATTGNQFLVRATGGISFATNIALTTGCLIPAGGGSWSCSSDKNVKANFANVDSRATLARVLDLPVTTWNYQTQDASIRHIGPMGQDFYAAFNVGEDDKHISMVDAQGVALAAIQGLNQVVQDKDKQIAAQQQQIDSLNARLTALEQQSPTSNAFTLNTLPLWGIVGLLALLLLKRRK